MRTNWRLYFRNMSRCRDVAFDYWTVSYFSQVPPDQVNKKGPVRGCPTSIWHCPRDRTYSCKGKILIQLLFPFVLRKRSRSGLRLFSHRSVRPTDPDRYSEGRHWVCYSRHPDILSESLELKPKSLFRVGSTQFCRLHKADVRTDNVQTGLFRPDSPIFSWENTD